MKAKTRFDSVYFRPLIVAALWNVIFYVLGKSIADFGVMLDHWMAASVIFWAVVIFILIRRPSGPTTFDLWFIKRGLLLAYGLMFMKVAFQT